MLTNFDPDQGAGNIQGAFTSVRVIDPAAPPSTQSNHVVDPTKSFDVELKWEINGIMAPIWIAALDESWTVKVYAESMGPGDDHFLASASVAKGTPGVNNAYTHTVTVPASSGLTEGNPGSSNSGVYKLVATAFLNSNLGAPGYDISGYAEGPMIRVENPA